MPGQQDDEKNSDKNYSEHTSHSGVQGKKADPSEPDARHDFVPEEHPRDPQTGQFIPKDEAENQEGQESGNKSGSGNNKSSDNSGSGSNKSDNSGSGSHKSGSGNDKSGSGSNKSGSNNKSGSDGDDSSGQNRELPPRDEDGKFMSKEDAG